MPTRIHRSDDSLRHSLSQNPLVEYTNVKVLRGINDNCLCETRTHTVYCVYTLCLPQGSSISSSINSSAYQAPPPGAAKAVSRRLRSIALLAFISTSCPNSVSGVSLISFSLSRYLTESVLKGILPNNALSDLGLAGQACGVRERPDELREIYPHAIFNAYCIISDVSPSTSFRFIRKRSDLRERRDEFLSISTLHGVKSRFMCVMCWSLDSNISILSWGMSCAL